MNLGRVGGPLSQTTQFNRIYDRHHRSVLAYCLRRTSESDAYDATSEVFSVAWRPLQPYFASSIEPIRVG